ncbi:MAG: hypothetical protein HQK78_17385, partial [Desulfobacterales bacterium]|nr:hypothetical protein [Desulfobacterales bacterium]
MYIIKMVLKSLFFLYLCLLLPLNIYCGEHKCVNDLLNVKELESKSFFQNLFSDQKGKEGFFLKEKKTIELTVDRACILAKQKNLNIAISTLEKKIAQINEIKKTAFFDPIISLSVNYTHTKTKARSDYFYRRRFSPDNDKYDPEKWQDNVNDDGEILENQSIIGGYTIDDETFVDESLYKTSLEEEYAIGNSNPTYFPGYWSGQFSILKAFTLGQTANLTLKGTYRERRYPQDIGEWTNVYNNFQEFPFGNNPWASNLSFELTTPLPYCKNFGKTGSYPYVLTKISEIEKKKSIFNEKANINNILTQVYYNYWEIIRNLKRLQIIIDHREKIEKFAKNSYCLLKNKEKTIYENSQIQASLANIRNQERILWSNYIISSNALKVLLRDENNDNLSGDKNNDDDNLSGDEDDNVLIFPVGYTKIIKENKKLSINYDKIFNNTLNNRQDLNALKEDKYLSEVLLNFRHN